MADLLDVSRSSIYDWLREYREKKGEAALDTRKAPGAPQVMTPDMDRWLRETILHSTPEAHGYDTVLWTLNILVDVLRNRFGLWVSNATVALHLHQMNLSCQRPGYRARQQAPLEGGGFSQS